MSKQLIEVEGQLDHSFDIELSEENAQASKLAWLLPGMSYRVDHPIFYFVRMLVHDLGFRTASVNYAYDQISGFRELEFDHVMEIFSKDARTIYSAIADNTNVDETLVVGKSLGTMIMAPMLANGLNTSAKLAWLTPSLRVPECEQQLKQHAEKSFVAIGTADPSHNPEQLSLISKAGAEVCVLEDLAHILEAKNDVPKGILGHHQMIVELSEWLTKPND